MCVLFIASWTWTRLSRAPERPWEPDARPPRVVGLNAARRTKYPEAWRHATATRADVAPVVAAAVAVADLAY